MADLTFRFTFIDGGSGAPRFTTNAMGPKGLELQLYNFMSPLGVGITEPLPVGQLAGRNIYILFTAYGVTDTPVKLVFCTFLQDAIATIRTPIATSPNPPV
jgi:hypothetical protein